MFEEMRNAGWEVGELNGDDVMSGVWTIFIIFISMYSFGSADCFTCIGIVSICNLVYSCCLNNVEIQSWSGTYFTSDKPVKLIS